MANEVRTAPEVLEERLDLIEGLIVRGTAQRHIVRWVREHNAELGWNISDRQVRNYFDQAQKRMSDRATQIDRKMYHVRSIQRLDHIYSRASNTGDLKEMRASTVELIKLLRLDEPNAEMDWKQAAVKAGINPDNFLQQLLTQHAEMAQDDVER